MGFSDGPLYHIKLSGMTLLERGQLKVYTKPEHKALAEEVIGALEEAWQIPPKQLGLELKPLRVVLVILKDNVGGVILERTLFETFLEWMGWQAPIFLLPFPSKAKSLKEADWLALFNIYWAMPHEATELMIARKVYNDRAARWIGDGLAEYMGYLISSELADQVQSRMIASRQGEIQTLLALEEGRKHYDLTREFLYREKLEESVEYAGYGVSLAFWLQIVQKHGKGVIKIFWERLSQRGFPNAQDAARILSELTGEDIWAKLQQMDLQEVLKTLEQAAGVP